MNCRRCGSPLMAGADYCTKCGAPVPKIPVKKKTSGCLIAGLVTFGVLFLGVVVIIVPALIGYIATSTEYPVLTQTVKPEMPGSHDVKILEAITGESFGDTELVIIVYEWTNKGDEVTTFSSEFDTTVYQNGVQLSQFFIIGNTEIDYASSSNKVQPGAIQKVFCAYKAGDASDLTVEVMASRGKIKVSKILTIE